MSSWNRDLILAVAGQGLATLLLDHDLLPDGRYLVRGTRPGADWHVHGSYDTQPRTLVGGTLTSVVVAKPRWKLRGTTQTCHSDVPDAQGRRYDGIVVALELFAWLHAAVGLHRYVSLFDGPPDRPSRRTVRRWLSARLPHAMRLQQAIREVVLERAEPRPFERLFPGGVSPPSRPPSMRWRDPRVVRQLHRGLAMLLGGAIALELPAASLFAEARRRMTTRTNQDS